MNDILTGGYSDLIEREDVGKVRSPRYQLPSPEFRYGKLLDRDAEGAGEVIRTWTFHTPSRSPPKFRDFKALNKLTVHNGFCDSRGMREFRKTLTAYETTRAGTKAIKLILPEDEFSYGVPNKPSTPITSVLSHEYGMRSALLTQEIYKDRLRESQRKTFYLPKVTTTTRLSFEKVSKKLEEMNNAEQKPLFKIKKFTRVAPRIDTINKGYVPANIRSASQAASTTEQK